YVVPSAGQKAIFRTFAPLGLTDKGFQIPADWGPAQRQALQNGYELGQQYLHNFIASTPQDPDTNYWGILNDVVGTYPNTAHGYLFRPLVGVGGGVANTPVDAVSPTAVSNGSDSDGNNPYTLTFPPPGANQSPVANGPSPPMVNDEAGNPKGFWSIHV